MAYNDKERNNEVEDSKDCITFKNKTMRRWKPQLQIYRPGSGPLRKSVQEVDDSDYNVNISQAQINDYVPSSKFNRKKPENAPFKNNNSENVNIVNQIEMGVDSKKRSKKPEQQLYVPKPVAQAMAERETQNSSGRLAANSNKQNNHEEHRSGRKMDMRNGNGNMSQHNGSLERLNSYPKPKRFSARKQGLDLEHADGDGFGERTLSPLVERRQGGRGGRDIRQGSEPRVIGPPSHFNRARDTRSVEPAGNNALNHFQGDKSEKIQAKPPSGRRHSTICLESGKSHKSIPNLEALAPRFRRKYLAENNIDPSSIPGMLEDTWDGSTITFKGSDSFQHPQGFHQERPNYPVPSYMNSAGSVGGSGTPGVGLQLQDHQQHHPLQQFPPQQVPPPAIWSNTIPNTRVRGRGRLRQDPAETTQYGSQVLRSLTPDRIMLLSPCNSRPCTPPPFAQKNKSMENVSYVDSRCQTPVSNQEVDSGVDRAPKSPPTPQKSAKGDAPNVPAAAPASPPKKTPGNASREDTDEILDWSEEVELNERLEAEALSDSMTRCSSVASLVESAPIQPTTHKSRKHKRSRGNRNRSSSRHSKRDKSTDNQNKNNSVNHDADNNHNNKQNRRNKSHSSKEPNSGKEKIDADGFKVPESRHRRRKNSFRDRSNERRRDRRSHDSRHSSLDRTRRDSQTEIENWREEIRLRCSSERKLEVGSDKKPELSEKKVESKESTEKSKTQAPGILILPQNSSQLPSGSVQFSSVDRSKPPVLYLPEPGRAAPRARSSPMQQRTLFDPNNPNKPIIVTSSNSRMAPSDPVDPEPVSVDLPPSVTCPPDPFVNLGPAWYDRNSDNSRACHFPQLLSDVCYADFELQCIIRNGALMHNWSSRVASLRKFFRDSLEYLLVNDIKFCQMENVENHYWKILYYNIIEIMRKSIAADPENKNQYKNVILSLIDEGTKYFERLLELLEETYKCKLDNYLGSNSMPPSKGLGFVGLALVSAQKIFLFLGDLARYREKVNDTSNYGKCRQWYIKAHEINPKNGRPYNQLALLAVYARRKLDAVYYYMRSLMASNPVQSAKESLISLFDENRKKYEQSERKRREEKAKLQMKEKESTQNVPNSLRREIWIHPDSGKRLHRTTSATQEAVLDSEEEDLHALTSVEVNRRFITSYLHVHGKLITKIGMETFQQTALQMLREFRVLLQQSPVPLTSNRFLHLLALNMFAIDSTQLKGPQLEPHCRSEVQERALVVSLQMFNIILERCVDLLQEHLRQQERAHAAAEAAASAATGTATTPGATKSASETQPHPLPLCQDLHVMLPAVKVWCDWMLCHSSVWNPPPNCADYKIGSSSDTWGRLATIMNHFEKLEYQKPFLEDTPSEDNDMVRLPEDATMCGFIPLMCNSQPPVFVRDLVDMESAQITVRIDRLLFFGTEFLCGLEPPVLKLQRYDTFSEYVSVVRTSSRDSPPSPPELCNEDLLLESFSEDEDEDGSNSQTVQDGASGEIRSLLDRKVELEKRQRNQELHRQRVQAILQQSVVSVEIEVRPRYLVPDTNCFIDYLDRLQALTRVHPQPYTLMVPLVVVGELEGLGRGGKAPAPAPRVSLDTEHLLRVAEAARRALHFLHCRNPAVKCLTTRGTVLASSTFTSEDEARSQDVGPRNDDRILAACLRLCRNAPPTLTPTSSSTSTSTSSGAATSPAATTAMAATTTGSDEGGHQPRKIYREVVLLTEDRNLRVKALARDVPVRELPDFLQWAGLG